MRVPSSPVILFWILMVAAPLAAAAVAIPFIPEAAQVPLHWGISGEVDRWGSPDELAETYWFMGGVMSALNLVLALCYLFNDVLYSKGLVHGVSREGALQVYMVLAVIEVVLPVAFFLGCNSFVVSAL